MHHPRLYLCIHIYTTRSALGGVLQWFSSEQRGLVWPPHTSPCRLLLFGFPEIVYGYHWKSKKWTQLYIWTKPCDCWHQARKAPVVKRMVCLFCDLFKAFHCKAGGGGMSWGQPSFRKAGTHWAQSTAPKPSPSHLPSVLPWGEAGRKEQRQHMTRKAKTENTAGNWRGNQTYGVISFFFFIKCT